MNCQGRNFLFQLKNEKLAEQLVEHLRNVRNYYTKGIPITSSLDSSPKCNEKKITGRSESFALGENHDHLLLPSIARDCAPDGTKRISLPPNLHQSNRKQQSKTVVLPTNSNGRNTTGEMILRSLPPPPPPPPPLPSQQNRFSMDFKPLAPNRNIPNRNSKSPDIKAINNQSSSKKKPEKPMPRENLNLGELGNYKDMERKMSVLIWGVPHPERMFLDQSDKSNPSVHQTLTDKNLVSISCAKDGTHSFGVTKNHWVFVWGETKYPACLGLGRGDTTSTTPFVLRSLTKCRIIQVVCSSQHGLALSENGTVHGWGNRVLTNLDKDYDTPQVLTFLLNGEKNTNDKIKKFNRIACSVTHSIAWSIEHCEAFSWGITGPWLGCDIMLAKTTIHKKNNEKSNANNDTKIDESVVHTSEIGTTFGRMAFHESIRNNSAMAIIKIECGLKYTLILLSDGMVFVCGTNEHGRMGIGSEISQMSTPIYIGQMSRIVDISAGEYHSGFVNKKGEVLTCGLGTHYQLGHQNETTYWKPTIVESLRTANIAKVECVHNRTIVVTKNGCMLTWGEEPLTKTICKKPKILEDILSYRIGEIRGGKDYNVAMGLLVNNPVFSPQINMRIEPPQQNRGSLVSNSLPRVSGIPPPPPLSLLSTSLPSHQNSKSKVQDTVHTNIYGNGNNNNRLSSAPKDGYSTLEAEGDEGDQVIEKF